MGNVTHEQEGDVALLRIDDGKANALSEDLQREIGEALDRAEKESRCVVLTGREGRFSGGFDLGVMRAGDAGAVARMVRGGAELALRLYGFPTPVVAACSGHAIAMGSLLLLCSDKRIGAQGDFKIGLNEVTIGMTLPTFAVELAKDRLSKRHLSHATIEAELYAPDDAVDAGFLDRTVAPGALIETSLATAAALAKLDAAAHRGTKAAVRGPTMERMRASLGTLG